MIRTSKERKSDRARHSIGGKVLYFIFKIQKALLKVKDLQARHRRGECPLRHVLH